MHNQQVYKILRLSSFKSFFYYWNLLRLLVKIFISSLLIFIRISIVNPLLFFCWSQLLCYLRNIFVFLWRFFPNFLFFFFWILWAILFLRRWLIFIFIIIGSRFVTWVWLTAIIIFFFWCRYVRHIPYLLIFEFFIWEEFLNCQFLTFLSQLQFLNISHGFILYCSIVIKFFILYKMFKKVNSHLFLSKVGLFLFCKVTLFLYFFIFLQSLIKHLILAVDIKMISTVSKWHKHSVRQAPSKASSHSHSECFSKIFYSKLWDIYYFWIKFCNF